VLLTAVWQQHSRTVAPGPIPFSIRKKRIDMSKSILLMTNHHRVGLFRGALRQISEVLHTWGDRSRMRRELARLSERELHDIGRSWSDIAHEVDKPFWRA
jgi:uncharacterized protein YjiS (DUF1127 family)